MLEKILALSELLFHFYDLEYSTILSIFLSLSLFKQYVYLVIIQRAAGHGGRACRGPAGQHGVAFTRAAAAADPGGDSR